MSIHEPANSVPPSTDRPLLDGCPACVINTELPENVFHAADKIRADYRCADCGHEWFTCWEVS